METGKRVSWVELYLDLIFVLAAGQLAHMIVADPEAKTAWTALGLFFVIWWTWIGFAALYNRFGDESGPLRAYVLAGSVPAGVAAVAIGPAGHGDVVPLAIALALTRVVLAAANARGGGTKEVLRGRIAISYLISGAVLLLSLAVPEPGRYVLWFFAISWESGQILRDDKHAIRRAKAERDWGALSPANPDERLDAAHFAERFGLFLIILLGEVVIEAGTGVADGHTDSLVAWVALAAAMVLGAALWWLYFDAAADVNERVLELSGGSPTLARSLYAIGHMLPAFSLLLIASGIGLLFEGEAERFAYFLPALGLGIYLLGTRAFVGAGTRTSRLLRIGILILTFNLARLHGHVDPNEYVLVLAGWTVMCAVLASRTPLRLLGETHANGA